MEIFNIANGQILLEDHNKAVDHINSAQTLISSKKYNNAITELELAIKLDSTIRDAYLLIYKASYYNGNAEISKKYLKKAKSIFVEDDEITYYLGKIYQAEKKYRNALTEYNDAIKYGKKNGEDYPIVFDYYASRGICYLWQNQYQKALSDFDYSLKLNAKNGGVYANRGIVLYKLRKYDEACRSWKKAYKMGQKSVKKYIDRNCK